MMEICTEVYNGNAVAIKSTTSDNGVVLNKSYDFSHRHKTGAVVGLIFVIRKLDGPREKLKMEGVPALADPPLLSHPPALENDMRASALTQIISHCQTGVPSADKDCFYRFSTATQLITLLLT